MDFKNKNILVCGIARSGISASILLKSLGANVTIQDLKKDFDNDIFNLLKNNNINLLVGKNPENDLINSFDLIVLSPGIPSDLDFVLYAKKKCKVISEIELAYILCSAPIVAITGTNGKTTTTSLTNHILKQFKKTYIVGNIGIPFSEKVLNILPQDIVVAEVSSFQLENIETFKPKVSTVLNISPDHLNRHKTMKNYILAKENIFKNQTKNDFLILNFEDENCIDMAKKTKAKILYFSSKNNVLGVYLKNDYIYINCFNFINEKFLNINDLKIFGIHNIENVMASILIALSFNVPLNIIKNSILSFKAVEHRIEFVACKNNVDYFNDSKGTNIDATLKAINSMKKNIFLILGGYDKGNDFKDFIHEIKNKVEKIILIGQVKEKIAKNCDEENFDKYTICKNLKDAVIFCYENSKNGDCVLLSPACASWDMFKDFEERGNIFKKYVNELKD